MSIIDLMPERLRLRLNRLSPKALLGLEELRIRCGKPLCLRIGSQFLYPTEDGRLVAISEQGICIMPEDMKALLAMLSQSSLYAFDEELRRGYITLQGGHRAGLCGHAVLEGGRLKSQRDISSVNIRVAHEHKGCSAALLPLLMKEALPPHTLIISPPACGKTTVLRDLAAVLSDSYGLQVGIIDERSELAAQSKGKSLFYVGRNTDILDACPKAEGIMLMLRSMSPQVIICDEIGRREDMEAVSEAVNAGVRIIASAHAASRKEISARPVAGELLRQHYFDMLAVYSRRRGAGTLEQVWQGESRIL